MHILVDNYLDYADILEYILPEITSALLGPTVCIFPIIYSLYKY